MPTKGLPTQDEKILQILPEVTPGVFPALGTPTIFSNAKHSWDSDDVYDSFDPDGYNDDDFASLIERKTKLDISEFVPYYNLLDDQFLQYLFGVPFSDVTAGGIRTREYRWPMTGRRNINTLAAQHGVPDSCRQAGRGFYTDWSVESQAGQGGKVRGKAGIRLTGYTEGNVLAGQGARNEVQTLTFTNVPSNTNVAVSNGTHSGTFLLSEGVTGLQSALQNFASIGSGNVQATGVLGQGTSSGTLSGTLTITFVAARAMTNMAQVTATVATGTVATATTAQGQAITGTLQTVVPLPVLPQHTAIYRADTLAALGGAASLVGTASKWSLDIAGLAEEWNAHNRSTDYLDMIQQKGTRMVGLNLPTDIGDHVSGMLDYANRYTSTAQWLRIDNQCPVTGYGWITDIYGAVKQGVPLTYNRKVEERPFSLGAMINRGDGFNFRMITKVPV